MDRDPFDLVGDVLDGQFRVDAFAGEGDLSVVYKGHHLGVDAPVAIKCLNVPPTLDSAHAVPLVDSFKEASRIHYRLARGNLNIAQSIASGSTIAPRTGTLVPYLIREWFEGESLAADLARRREQKRTGRSLPEALALLEAAFDGVSYAHELGEVHLSLNPSNFFLATTPEGVKLKVLDFGVASAMNDDASGPGARRGLRVLFPAYAAPEQLDRSVGAQGPWTDVYALALLTLEVLSDRVVMSEPDPGAIVEHALDAGRRPTPQAHGLKLPRNVELVLTRALLLEPQRRQKTATELWRDIKSAVRPAASVAKQAAVAVPPATLVPALGVAPPPAGAGAPAPAPAAPTPRVPAASGPSAPLRPRAATLVGMGVPPPAVVVGAVGSRLKVPSTPSVETQPMSFQPVSQAPQNAFGVEPETLPRAATPSPARAFPPSLPFPPPLANGAAAPHPEPASSPSPSPSEVTDLAPAELVAELVAKSAAEPVVEPVVEPVAQLPPVAPAIPPVFQAPVQPVERPPAATPLAEAPAQEAWEERPSLSFLDHASLVATRWARELVAVANAPKPGAAPPSPRRRGMMMAGLAACTVLIIVLAIVAVRRHPARRAPVVPPPPPATASAAPAPPPPETTAPEPSASPPPAAGPPFKAAPAKRALDLTSHDVAKCRKGKKWGTAFATVTFANDGTVSHVDIGAPFRGTPTGDCVAEGLGTASIPPFGGPPGTVVYRFFVGAK